MEFGICRLWGSIAVSDQGKYFEGLGGFAPGIKEGLIVHSTATVPFSCIIGIVFCGEGGCPSGAILLPTRLIFLVAAAAGGDPCSFPVKNTDGIFCTVDHGVDHIPDKICLTLLGEGVIVHRGACAADGVAEIAPSGAAAEEEERYEIMGPQDQFK